MKINGYTITATVIDAYLTASTMFLDESGEEREPSPEESAEHERYLESLKGQAYLVVRLVNKDESPEPNISKLQLFSLRSQLFDPKDKDETSKAIHDTFESVGYAIRQHALQNYDLSDLRLAWDEYCPTSP